jgi:predicted nuclease of restriction endonuclease-like (RecB) superfamily
MKLPKRTKSKPAAALKTGDTLDFTVLVASIREVHDQSAAHAARTVNTTLTLRNWIIGAYIHHYELHGADRAKYGDSLIGRLAEKLMSKGLERMDERELRRYRLFYITYREIRESLTPEFIPFIDAPIWRSPTAKSITPPPSAIRESVTPELVKARHIRKAGTLSPPLNASMRRLVGTLSFTHIAELIAIADPLKRAFYEIECMRGNWSVRALKRQIATLYFERSGLSKDKDKLAAMVAAGIEAAEPRLAIRDPYIFEFLGLRAKDAVAESDLEAALVENLREFLLELGHGFCLEAQQKSIVIGETRGFVDLVFYHRILKCHVLVDLKVDSFTHEHIGQLNAYVSWYRDHMMAAGDNPPVGLLLCTEKDHALVEYATASMDNRLFVSRYAVALPSREELAKFIHARHTAIEGPPR